MALGKFKQALRDFEAVKKARPKDPDAIVKYNECSKIVRQQAFARAIAVEVEKSVADSIDVESMGKLAGSDRHTDRQMNKQTDSTCDELTDSQISVVAPCTCVCYTGCYSNQAPPIGLAN